LKGLLQFLQFINRLITMTVTGKMTGMHKLMMNGIMAMLEEKVIRYKENYIFIFHLQITGYSTQEEKVTLQI
jgi:hypothetical protein